MSDWQNWSGRHRADAHLHHARSEADIQALVQECGSNGTVVRAAGAGHSHFPLVPSDGVVLDTSALSGVISTDPKTRTAWVWGGTRIYALGRALHDAGLALANQGDIDQQAIAGATATGTHGTGRQLTNLSARVVGMRLVDGSGALLTTTASERPEVLQAARLHLGAFGIVTALQLQLVDAYRLQEQTWQSEYDKLADEIQRLPDSHRHYEFFWYPGHDTATVKVIDETDTPPEYPVGAEGTRSAWSYEVLPNHRPHKHTEMEYSVPAAEGAALFCRDSQAAARGLS